MAALAPRMAAALTAGDIHQLGLLVAEQWTAQRALHPTISTPRIDSLVHDAAAAGALGTKALGASGGGCVLVIHPAGRACPVRAAIERHADIIPFRVARDGVHLHVTGDTH
jgi:D-glycero-alpha-D-manno-heptose-7-phosphate kinase